MEPTQLPEISLWGSEDFPGSPMCPCLRAVATAPPERFGASALCANPCCLRPIREGSASEAIKFRGHLCVRFRYGPMTRSSTRSGLCWQAPSVQFPSRPLPMLRGVGSSLGRSPFLLNTLSYAGRTRTASVLHPGSGVISFGTLRGRGGASLWRPSSIHSSRDKAVCMPKKKRRRSKR